MKTRFATVAVAAIAATLALASAAPLWAQMNPSIGAGTPWQSPNNGAPNGQAFQKFVRRHPRIGTQLQSNPNLLWDANWRKQHPQVGQWIQHHQPLWNQMVASQGGSPYQQKWQGFLAHHSRIANQLNTNPNLLYNARWRANHPELTKYLSEHPQVRNSLWSSAPATTYPSTYGGFARNYPGVMNQLNTNPGLVNNPAYLNQHPQFAGYLRDHPGFQEDMRDRAEYWRHHHSYDGWRWHHAWNDSGAAPWTPPGLQHSNGHAYGWYRHHAQWSGPPAGPEGARDWHGHDGGHGHGHGWDHGHGHGGDHGYRHGGDHGHGGWDHGHGHDND